MGVVMTVSNGGAEAGTASQAVQRALMRFGHWYAWQLRTLLPPHVTRWLTQRGPPRLLIRALPDPTKPQDYSAAVAKTHASGGEAALLIDAGSVLLRQFDIPREAAAHLSAVLAADIARKTPLNPADVFDGHATAPLAGAPGKLRVTHAIVRRDIAMQSASCVGLTTADLASLIPVDATGRQSGPEIRLRPRRPPYRWPGRLTLALTMLAASLIAGGAYDTVDRLDQAATDLDAKIAVAAREAQSVRRQLDGAASESALLASLLRDKASQPGLLDVWEDLSRLLPDGTWISDLRLTYATGKSTQRTLAISGVSDAAAALVPLLNRSRVLNGAVLTAAITPDPAEGKDRFSLETQITLAEQGALPVPAWVAP